MIHIYNCKHLNNEEPSEKYENLFCGNLNEQIIVFRRFEENIEKRQQYSNIDICDNEEQESDHAIHDSDLCFVRVW
jgi:hypothetical protein